MYINEACRAAGTTKKAVEYYCEKGLISPAVSENGYRVFSEEDVGSLKKISLLRSLGVSVEDIRILLPGTDEKAFGRTARKLNRKLLEMEEKNRLFEELAKTGDWAYIEQKAAMMEEGRAVSDRLRKAFPGAYGKFLSLYFGSFLTEPIRTADQEAAYREICAYLDGVSFDLPEDLKAFLEETYSDLYPMAADTAGTAASAAAKDPEGYLEEHRDAIEAYMEFKKSDVYKASPAFRLMQALKSFNQEKGYDTVFIPAMRRLSPSYDAYQAQLLEANRVFLQKYPDYSET